MSHTPAAAPLHAGAPRDPRARFGPPAAAWVAMALAALIVAPAAGADAPPADPKAPAPQTDADGTPIRVLVVDPAKPGDLGHPGHANAIAAYAKQQKLAPEVKIQVIIKDFYDPSVGIRKEIHSLTPLDAQGKPDGLESHFFMWRGVTRTISWKAGVKHGPETVINDGKVKSITPWANGKMHGSRQVFHANGKLANETPYVEGVESGESKSFETDGSLSRVTLLKNGKREGDMIDYWPGTTQARKIVPYREGKIQGLVREFYLNGKPKREILFKDNFMHGSARDLDDQGKVVKTAWYFKGDEVSKEEFEKRK